MPTSIISTIPEIQTSIISTIPGIQTSTISTIPEITYYDNIDYCLSNNYYYHINTKECVLNGCRENYYQFNFECYINNCPDNSSLISPDNIKCETDLNYCYIDEKYKTYCNNEQFSEYKLRYKDTKIYFKSCNESLYFFNIKTYLYKNICYENCPEETIKDDTNNRCICKYYILYLDDGKNDYECLSKNETCKDKNKYTIISTKECIDSLQQCININYKIFNEECYIDCPDDKIPLGSIENNAIKNELINELKLTNNLLSDSLCICDTTNKYIGWINNISNPSLQICLGECPDNYRLDLTTHKCYEFKPIKDEACNNYLYFNKIMNEYLCVVECPSDMPYLKNGYLCDYEYSLIELFSNEIKIININQNIMDEIFLKIKNELERGKLDNLLSSIIDGKNDLVIEAYNIIYQIISTNYKNNENKNISIISLGDCENKLKEFYNINKSEPLIIFKIDVYEEGLLIPTITYEVYNSNTKKKLDLSICKDTKIKISLPAKVDEKNIFKYNASDEYYNDDCYIYTTEDGTDITLTDRKSEYNNKNMSLCEVNCEYKGYNITTNKSQCECKIKKDLSSISEMIKNPEKILNNFPGLKNATNFKIIKCFKYLFTKEGLKTNIGSYILLFIILVTIFLLILFFFKGYKIIFKIIEIIANKIEEKDKSIKTDENDKQSNNINNDYINNNILILSNSNIIKNPPKKYVRRSIKNKDHSKNINILKTNEDNKKDNSSSRIEIKINQLEKDNIKNKLKDYLIKDNNDYELNKLSYKVALKIDKRTYCQYYISLIKRKQIIIFAFFTKDDYNSRYIKICLFFFYFALSYTVNALFFNDATMHKIYVDQGSFNIIYQLPKIIYSTIIISIINIVVTFLSLSEKIIIELKNDKGNKKEKKQEEVKKYLIIKFIIFFIIIIIMLILFWYYISCFCAIYKNTQIHLIKDTLISFGFSLLYPFVIYLIPGIFRIYSLKSKNQNKECLYKFSSFIQLL